MTILIIDTETTGLDPSKHAMIEVAWATLDECHADLLDCRSMLVRTELPNNAYHINLINGEMIQRGVEREFAEAALDETIRWHEPRAIVAHNAAFDRRWLPTLARVPWVCSCLDIDWPERDRCGTRPKLETLALAHGVSVVPGHRALTDVMTLVRVFYAVGLTESLITKALRPKAVYEAHVSFGQNSLAKAAGFMWDPEKRRWLRTMPIEDWAEQASTWGFDSHFVEGVGV